MKVNLKSTDSGSLSLYEALTACLCILANNEIRLDGLTEHISRIHPEKADHNDGGVMMTEIALIVTGLNAPRDRVIEFM